MPFNSKGNTATVTHGTQEDMAKENLPLQLKKMPILWQQTRYFIVPLSGLRIIARHTSQNQCLYHQSNLILADLNWRKKWLKTLLIGRGCYQVHLNRHLALHYTCDTILQNHLFTVLHSAPKSPDSFLSICLESTSSSPAIQKFQKYGYHSLVLYSHKNA